MLNTRLTTADGLRFLWRTKLSKYQGLLYVLPVILGTIYFNIVPMLSSFYLSFTHWNGLRPAEFVGFSNYLEMFTYDRYFIKSLINTLYFVFASIPLNILFSLGLALLLNLKTPGNNFFRTTFFAPVVTSPIAIGIVFSWLFASDYGLINHVLSWINIHGPAWLDSRTWAMPAVIITSVWQGAGYNMILFLAGLQGIPDVLHEAALIDGANTWQRFRYVTLPLLTPTIFFVTIMSFIRSFQVFGLIYVMTEGGPANATMVYVYYLYQNAFSFFKMGYASALAWVLFLIIGIITLIQWYGGKHWVFYNN